ncbi:copper resistance protein NlpE N-terminal domain-containing protein [Flavobacterium wongokense]|uniref:copper resistance protein NlpE N-terminal domain-containing protein n=1 Tax=Flavobacterium wongokense TaxID=2910674 RepID=UPI001F39B7B4|nr:copper resistance protein NlpE N-terminal domain-containing protein [Flavobacterium sp. WG47]MCF6132563.1 copper resistance protein NlpE N-terminal domain-containing protein [Flavobacterium sp. WG47]
MKKSLLLLFVLTIGCQKQTVKKEDAASLTHNAKNSLDYIGTYKGILPCADCNGLETEIAINENSTFSIKTKYQGKGDKLYVQKGHFTWNKKGNTIILTDVKNGPNQYFVGENTLTQLDLTGKKITGKLAEEYKLFKQPADTSKLETVEEHNAATVDLNSRMSTTTVIQKVNPAVGKYTLAETKWKLVSLKNKKIIQKGEKVYFLKLNSKDNRFTAFAGCNSIAGNYVMPTFDTIDFSDVIMTRMACPDMTIEDQFGAMLVQVVNYKVDQNILTFFGEGRKVIARFEAI